MWVIASLLRYPGRFSVFWPMMLFRLLKFLLPCPNLPATFSSVANTIGVRFSLLFHSFSNSKYCSSFPFLFILPCGQQGQQSPQIGEFYFLLVVWLRLDDLFVCQNQRVFCVSHFPGQMMGWAYTICSYGQTLFSCKVQEIVFLFDFLDFHFVIRWDSKVNNTGKSVYLYFLSHGLLF